MTQKKIGILTLHSSINYGVYLQAYAMQESIKIIGYSPTILDYNRMVEDDKKRKKGFIYRFLHARETINALRLKKFRSSAEAKQRANLFAQFSSKYFCLSTPIKTFEELKVLSDDFDSFVCGSDQIWNPNYTMGNPAYFLAFASKNKRNMYAPSFGVTDLRLFEKYTDVYKTFLKELHSISVRESSGVSIVQSLSGLTPTVVVDPTLLLPIKCWEDLEIKPQRVPDHYVLFYVLGNDLRYDKIATRISKKLGSNIVIIPNSPIWGKNGSYTNIYAGVENFLYLIHHADYVVTDSFHGVAFSTIYKKDFTALKREDTDFSLSSRIEDYLDNVGLMSACESVTMYLNKLETNKIDYSDFEKKFPIWQKNSWDYLTNSFK